jgi:group I intron endonuclease
MTEEQFIDNSTDEKVYGIIYKYESPSNKIYIGQTINPEKRKQQHIQETINGSTKIFHNAIRKYGIDSFNYEILHKAYSKEELNELEIYYIEKYNSYYKNDNGYNMTFGGDGTNGYNFTEDDKIKLSISLKQYYEENPQSLINMSNRVKEYNKLHPEKVKNHSIFMKEFSNLQENREKSINTFKKYYEDNPESYSINSKEVWQRNGHKEKMSNIQKEYLENHPQEKTKRIQRLIQSSINNKENHSKYMKEKSKKPENIEIFKNRIKKDREENPEKYNKSKEKRRNTMNTQAFKENMSKIKTKILPRFKVFDKENKLVGEFNNTSDCIKELNLPTKPSIVMCLNGKLKQSAGYTFRYID